MAERKPLVLVDGVHRAMDPADTLPATNLPTVTALVQGAMPAELFGWASMSGMIDADTGLAPLPGYLYRGNGVDGQVVKAQGDTAAHVAGIVGIGSSTVGLLPLSGTHSLIMDAAPVKDRAVYPSSATAGIGSHTPTALGILPLGSVSSVLPTVNGTYWAKVRCPYQSLLPASSLLQQLDEETLSLLGGASTDWSDAMFDHFDKVAADAGGYRCPTWGQYGANTWAASQASCVTIAPAKQWYLGAETWVRTGVSLLGFPWRLSVRMKQATNGYSNVGIDGYSATVAHVYCNLRCDTAGHWALNYGTDEDGTTTLALGTNNGSAFAQLSVVSPGDGTLRTQINYGAWSAPISDAYTIDMAANVLNGGVFNCGYATNVAMTLDHVYFRQRLP